MQRINRVAVAGLGGSGRSYLARELGWLLDAPVTHLDAVFFDDAWNPLPQDKFEAVQREMVAAPRWVIDGNYNSTLHVRLEACDTVVMIDVPAWAALWGIFSRQMRHGAGQHGAGVYNRIHWGVISYVATYRRRMRPRVLGKIQLFAGENRWCSCADDARPAAGCNRPRPSIELSAAYAFRSGQAVITTRLTPSPVPPPSGSCTGTPSGWRRVRVPSTVADLLRWSRW